MKTVGQIVREARETTGVSQRTLCEMMGWSKDRQGWISDVENDKVIPDVPNLLLLSKTLNIQLENLMLAVSFQKARQSA